MLSKAAYILCLSLLLYVSFIFYPKWNNKAGESSMGWDAATYYWYLPATFIYKDLRQLKFGDSIIARYKFTPTADQSNQQDNGNEVIVYSSGVALVQLPAFAAGHFAAKLSGYPTDGFSKPYQVAIQVWGLLAGIVGLWLFRRLLLLYVSDAVTAVVLVMLVFGTNYLNYAAIDVTITHSYLFTLYVLLLLNTHHFYVTHKMKHALAADVITGLIILVRPSEMPAILIPLLWGMEGLSLKAIQQRLRLLVQHKEKIIGAAVACVAIGSIQVVYWLYVAGKPFVYSYDDKTFSWLAPHTWEYFTDTSSGWLMYNPMILFVLMGIIPFIKYGRSRVVVLAFFILTLYVVSAWDIWWYSGIGGRAMIQSYAVIFFPAAALVAYVLKHRWLIWLTTPFFLFFIYINLWVVYNAHAQGGLYDTSRISGNYYWAVIGRWSVDEEVIKLKEANNIYTGKLYDKELVYYNGFEAGADTEFAGAIMGNGSFHAKAYTNSEQIVIEGLPENKRWLRVQCTYKCLQEERDMWKMFRLSVSVMKNGAVLKGEAYKPQRFLKTGETRTIHYDMLLPEEGIDKIGLVMLNDNSEQELLVDECKIWTYNDK